MNYFWTAIIFTYSLASLAQDAPTIQERVNAFNPSITAFGTLTGCIGNQSDGGPENEASDHGDHVHGGCNQFVLGEVELDLRASIDPWADGVLILAIEQGLPNRFSVQVEEGYVLLKNLPIINKAPWGMKLKLGRFGSMFGRMNRIHTHDLPQNNLPSSLQAFFGDHGLRKNGGSLSFFIPTPGEDNALELTLEMTDGGGLEHEPVLERGLPAFVSHLSLFLEPWLEHQFELGASAYVEPVKQASTLPSQLYGIDFNYSFKPVRAGEWRSLFVGGEVMASPVREKGQTPLGLFVWSQYQFNQRTYLGIRYDHVNGVEERFNGFHGFGVFLTYYTTEFLRFRIGYERKENFATQISRNQFMFDMNFVFGSHPVEPYWVVR